MRKGYLFPVIGFIILALILTWPLIIRFSTHIVGNKEGCVWVHLWTAWLVKRAFLHGEPLTTTDYIFHPIGSTRLPFTSANLLNPLILIPFQLILGLTRAYNALVLISVFLSGITMYFLAREVTGDRRSAFLSGVIFAATPCVLLEIENGVTEIAATYWLPLYVLFFLRAMKERGWKNTVLAGIFLALSAHAYAYYAVFLLIFSIYYLIEKARKLRREANWKRNFAKAVAIFLFLLLTSGPLYLSKNNLIGKRQHYIVSLYKLGWTQYRRDGNAALLDYFKMGKIPKGKRSITFVPYTTYLGFITLVLALIAFGDKRCKERFFWGGGAAVFFVISLGYLLRISDSFYLTGKRILVPLPGFILHPIPFVSRTMIHSFRYSIMFMLCMAILAGTGIRSILSRMGGRAAKTVCMVTACILIVLEVILLSPVPFPMPMSDASVPEVYQQLQPASPPHAIIELPYSEQQRINGLYMYYQTRHMNPLLNSVFSTDLAGANFDYLRNSKFLLFLLGQQANLDMKYLIEKREVPEAAEIEEGDIDLLRRDGFRYIILHNDQIKPEVERRLHSFLKGWFPKWKKFPDGSILYDLMPPRHEDTKNDRIRTTNK